MTESFIVEHRDVFYCPWCGRHYLRKQDVKHHANLCRKNPENVNPCFWCSHLEQANASISFQWIGAFGRYQEGTREISSFYCNKHEQWLYSKIAGKKRHPCSEDPDHFPMPSNREDFSRLDSYGNPVSWDLETFVGKPWGEKRKRR